MTEEIPSDGRIQTLLVILFPPLPPYSTLPSSLPFLELSCVSHLRVQDLRTWNVPFVDIHMAPLPQSCLCPNVTPFSDRLLLSKQHPHLSAFLS